MNERGRSTRDSGAGISTSQLGWGGGHAQGPAHDGAQEQEGLGDLLSDCRWHSTGCGANITRWIGDTRTFSSGDPPAPGGQVGARVQLELRPAEED